MLDGYSPNGADEWVVEEMVVGCEDYEDKKLTLDLKSSILKSSWRPSRDNPLHKMAVLGKILFEHNLLPTFVTWKQ